MRLFLFLFLVSEISNASTCGRLWKALQGAESAKQSIPRSVGVEISDVSGKDSMQFHSGTQVPVAGAKLGFDIPGNEAFVIGRIHGDTRYSQTPASNKLGFGFIGRDMTSVSGKHLSFFPAADGVIVMDGVDVTQELRDGHFKASSNKEEVLYPTEIDGKERQFRASTNGTWIQDPTRGVVKLRPGDKYLIPFGQAVQIFLASPRKHGYLVVFRRQD